MCRNMLQCSAVFLNILLMTGLSAQGTTYYNSGHNTGNYAFVAIPADVAILADGVAFETGDEIGVFTPDGKCVGGTVYSESFGTSITVWGDDPHSPEVDGIRGGEAIKYRFWKKDRNKEYVVKNITYSQGDGIYTTGGIYVVSGIELMKVTPGVDVPDLLMPENRLSHAPTTLSLVWRRVDDFDTYNVQLTICPVFSEFTYDEEVRNDTLLTVSDLKENTTYYWKVRGTSDSLGSDWSYVWTFNTSTLMSTGDVEGVPAGFELNANYPNPFNPSTVISYLLPVRSLVRLEVYNTLGEKVSDLVDREQQAGRHDVTFKFDGPSGVYFYRLEAVASESGGNVFSETRKMLLVR